MVNAELYDFLKDNETGLFKRGNNIIAYVHIDFCDLDDFIKIVGSGYFEEEGINVKMFNYSICIELNDIIENCFGQTLIDYKNCFNSYDWEYYE